MFTSFLISLKGGLEFLDLPALLYFLLLIRFARNLLLVLVTASVRLAWPLRIELLVLAHRRHWTWCHLKWLSFLLLLATSNFLLRAEVVVTKGELDADFALRFTISTTSTFVRKCIRLHRFHRLDRIIFLHICECLVATCGYLLCTSFIPQKSYNYPSPFSKIKI